MDQTHQSKRKSPELRAHFDIPYYQYINEEGQALCQLPQFSQDKALLVTLYEAMVKSRLLDKKCIALQRTGKMGTYPSILGQEAVGVGIGYAMRESDVFVPYYRDMATQMIRGVDIKEVLLCWGGDERGNDFKKAREDFPNCVPIATQITHAAGVASAIKSKNQIRAVVTTAGDGATSRGDFYEALNLAGAWQLPLVVVVNNNQWAISVPRQLQTAAQTLAQKGIAAGIHCEQVDGCDILAVYEALTQALKKAYEGKGPSLIEAITYRLSDHTTADDATRYRAPDAVKDGWKMEPIKRFRNFLHDNNVWSEEQEKNLYQRCEIEINQGVEEYLKTPAESPSAMFDYLYQELPESLREQRQHVMAKTGGHPHG